MRSVLKYVALATLVWFVPACGAADADGPAPVVWDKEPCAHCRMLVGEKAFAAQLRTEDGKVMNFDDPGCLFEYEAAKRPKVARLWFRHHKADRWIPGEKVRFVTGVRTPMNYGLAAVDENVKGSLSLAEARARVVGTNGGGSGGGSQHVE